MNKIKYITLFIALILLEFNISAKEPADKNKDKKWDISAPHGITKDVKFSTKEGTWISVDLSPDGQLLVFDVLGNVYTMPTSGGKATCILSGPAYECQPRFSPNGKKILFTSDRDGGDNIWYCDIDGKNPKQITKESFRLCNNATWLNDEYIIAKKHFTGTRSLGAGEMWQYHITGGSGIQLTKRKNDQQDVGEPEASPNSKYLYFSEDMTEGPYFQYNKNPHAGIYGIRRYNLENGKIDELINGTGGACRPILSKSGKYLAYVSRVGIKSILNIYDLKKNISYPVFDGLDKDQQETWALFGVYPHFCFSKDESEIFISFGGHLNKVNIYNGKVSMIPFEVEFNQTITQAVNTPQKVFTTTFQPKMLRNLSSSLDGTKITFIAAGNLYLANYDAKKITNPTIISENNKLKMLPYFPSFNAQGDKILYIGFNDSEYCSILEYDCKSKTTKTLLADKSFYEYPVYSPSGSYIAYQKTSGNEITGLTSDLENGIYILDLKTLKSELLSQSGSKPRFSKDGNFVFVNNGKTFTKINIKTREKTDLYSSKYAKDYTIDLKNEKYFAFTDLFNGYLIPFISTGNQQDASAGNDAIPQYQFTRDYGNNIHFCNNSIRWTNGNRLFERKIEDCFSYIKNIDSLPPIDTIGTEITFELESSAPKNSKSIAFMNARIITADKDKKVIENGYIIVENNKIISIGDAKGIKLANNYTIIDCNGKTIMPGIVDVHAHMGQSGNGITPYQQWSYHANLAYGVTTTHDPSANTEMIFYNSELQKAGQIIAPRIYSTGSILYGADGDFKVVINKYEDALSALRRLKSIGGFSVKSYNQPRRNQRQMIIQAANQLGMMVYPEGGSTLFWNLNQIMDGHTGIEHSIPVSPLYNDVVQLWSNTKVGYTPTLIVSYGGIWGENYWYQKTNVYADKHLLNFYPRAIIDAVSRRRMMVSDDDFGHIKNAESVKKLYDAGVQVQLGAHGQLHGLGAHWEMWMFVQGGMTPLQAIESSTISGAKYIGMDKEIGSLEVGKLADFLILDKNPLEDIKNSNSIKYVIQNGVMYQSENLNQLYPKKVETKPFYFQKKQNTIPFDWHQINESKCSCHQ